MLQLANSINLFLKKPKALEEIINEIPEIYDDLWQKMIGEKLGFKNSGDYQDKKLIEELFDIFEKIEIDMTLFFRKLALIDYRKDIKDNDFSISPLLESFYGEEFLISDNKKMFLNWLNEFSNRVRRDNPNYQKRIISMNSVNPRFILRNYISQIAIEHVDQGNFNIINELLEIIKNPYDEKKLNDQYFKKRPEWAKNKIGCSMLSCSS